MVQLFIIKSSDSVIFVLFMSFDIFKYKLFMKSKHLDLFFLIFSKYLFSTNFFPLLAKLTAWLKIELYLFIAVLNIFEMLLYNLFI